MKTTHRFFVLLPSVLLLNSCITVGVSKEAKPAKNLEFNNPSAFTDLKSKTGDKAWISNKTNNVISYISDCSQSQDPSLDQLEQDALSGLEKLEIKAREEVPYNQRIGRFTTGEGYIDGVKVKLQVLSFKKNGCSYNLIYGGQADRFAAENQDFKNFTESFKAP